MKASLCLLLASVSSATAWLSRTESRATCQPLYNTVESTDSSEPETRYQRYFYRFSPSSDVDIPDALVVEERVRFQKATNQQDWWPVGHRTILLREGQVPDGEIGDCLATLSVDSHDATVSHAGAGTDRALVADLVTALYVACNPSLATERVLQVGSRTGLGGLLGCMGAGLVARTVAGATRSTQKQPKQQRTKDIADQVLTIGSSTSSSSASKDSDKDDDGILPPDLDMLVLTDIDSDSLNAIFHNCKHSGVSAAKIAVEALDWRHNQKGKEFHTVLASDLAFSYPEAKALARTVAYRLQPLDTSLSLETTTTPRFVHIAPEGRDDVTYLRRLLEQGYKMTVDTGYLKVEQLKFAPQTLPMSEPEEKLDDMELELVDLTDLSFGALVGQHHVDYGGGGEFFFPMETGEYDQRSGSTYLESDWNAH